MKYLYRSISSSTVNNKINTLKICKNCKFFIANTKECKYINNINLVTGQKTFEYATIMRNNDCGPDAKYFESDEKSKVKTKLSCPSKYFSTFLV